MHPAADKPVGHSAAGAEETGERRPAATGIDREPRRQSPPALRCCDPHLPTVLAAFDIQIRAGVMSTAPRTTAAWRSQEFEPRAIQVPAMAVWYPGGNRFQPELAAPEIERLPYQGG